MSKIDIMRSFEDVQEQLNNLTTSVHDLLGEVERRHKVISEKLEKEGNTDENIQLLKEFNYSKVIAFKSMLTRVRELKLDDWAGYTDEVKDAILSLETGLINASDNANVDLIDTNNKQDEIKQITAWLLDVDRELQQMVKESEKDLAEFKALHAQEGSTEKVLDVCEDLHRSKVEKAKAFLEKYHEKKKQLYHDDLLHDLKITILNVETTLTRFATDSMEDLAKYLTERYKL